MACVGTSSAVKSVQVASSDVTHMLKDPRLYLVLLCNWSEYEGKAWERGYILPWFNSFLLSYFDLHSLGYHGNMFYDRIDIPYGYTFK